MLSALCWVGGVAVAIFMHQWTWLQDQISTSDLSWVPPSLRWFGRHAIAINVAMLLTCVAGAVSCWGLLRRQRWALWLFMVLLVLTALLNFVGVWMVDDLFHQLLVHLPASMDDVDTDELIHEIRLQRWLYTGMTLATAVSFAVLHAWLLVRLLRPDVKAWFERRDDR